MSVLPQHPNSSPPTHRRSHRISARSASNSVSGRHTSPRKRQKAPFLPNLDEEQIPRVERSTRLQPSTRDGHHPVEGADVPMHDVGGDEVEDDSLRTLTNSPQKMALRDSLHNDSTLTSFLAGSITAITASAQSSAPFRPDPDTILDELVGLYADAVAIVNIIVPPSGLLEKIPEHIALLHDPHSQLSARLDRSAKWFFERRVFFSDELYIRPSVILDALSPQGTAPSSGVCPAAVYRPDELLMMANLATYLVHVLLLDRQVASPQGGKPSSALDAFLAPSDHLFPTQFASSVCVSNTMDEVGSTQLDQTMFEHGLSIRTQRTIDHLRRDGDSMLGAESFISSLFYLSSTGSDEPVDGISGSTHKPLRPWPLVTASSHFAGLPQHHYESITLERVSDIKEFCSGEGDDDDDDDEDADADDVNIAGLEQKFPWSGFVDSSMKFVRARADEIESIVQARGGADRIGSVLRRRDRLAAEMARADQAGSLLYRHPVLLSRPADRPRPEKLFNPPDAISRFGLAMSTIIAAGAKDAIIERPQLPLPAYDRPSRQSTVERNYMADYDMDSTLNTASNLIRLSQSEAPAYPNGHHHHHHHGRHHHQHSLSLPIPHLPSQPSQPVLPRRFIDPQLNAERVSFSQSTSAELPPLPTAGLAGDTAPVPNGYHHALHNQDDGDAEMRDPVDDGPPAGAWIQSSDVEEEIESDEAFERPSSRRRPRAPTAERSKDDAVSRGRDFHSVVMSHPRTATDPNHRAGLTRAVRPARALARAATTPVPPVRRVSNPDSVVPNSGMSRPRRRWSPEEEQALIKYVTLFRASCWAEIKRADEMEDGILLNRTQVDLKDKARNLRLAMEKRGRVLPGFETVTLKATQVSMLEELRASRRQSSEAPTIHESPRSIQANEPAAGQEPSSPSGGAGGGGGGDDPSAAPAPTNGCDGDEESAPVSAPTRRERGTRSRSRHTTDRPAGSDEPPEQAGTELDGPDAGADPVDDQPGVDEQDGNGGDDGDDNDGDGQEKDQGRSDPPAPKRRTRRLRQASSRVATT